VGEEIRSALQAQSRSLPITHTEPYFYLHILQDAQAKYRESKAELDELVQNMEGL
jgi:hypothetical protein